jgi:signal transduction histidine kinase
MSDRACRVLLIEDDPNDVRLLKSALENRRDTFELSVVSTLTAGLDALSAGSWNAVLSDLSLPDAHGLDAVRQLRSSAPDLPIIVLTGLASDGVALESLDHGAQDYLVKDRVTPEIIDRSIRYAVQRQKNHAMSKLLEKLQASERILAKKNRRLKRLYKTAHRFVDNVSHEFRTPLTVVNEYVSLLRDGVVGDLSEEQKRMLDVIGDRAGDLNNMVDDMLDISKLGAGMLGLWRRNCTVADVVDHVRPSLVRKSLVKDVELQFDIPDELPEIYCDDEKIGRVLVNLAVNAIKFCGQPGLVQIWAEYQPQNRQIVIGVTDNGDGIAPENLGVIFQRFKQVGENPSSSTMGFGLGLNIAKELVHLNYGQIEVKSAVGKGSTFWFSLPIADAQEVMRRYANRIAQFQNGPHAISLVRATVSASSEDSMTNDVNTFLNTLLRRHDLTFRTDSKEWLMAVSCDQLELEGFFAHVEETREKINRNRLAEPLPALRLQPLGTWPVADGLEGLLSAANRALHLPVARLS